MRYDSNGSKKLFAFVEDILYSLSKAFPEVVTEDAKIRYVKSRLPSAIKPILATIPSYNTAVDLKEFLKGIKQYDILKPGQSMSPESKDPVKPSELASLLTEIAKGIKKEAETTRAAIAAFQQAPRSSSPSPRRNPSTDSGRMSRDPSPRRQGPYRDRPVSPYMNRQRFEPAFSDRGYYHQPQFVPGNYHYPSTNYYGNQGYPRTRPSSPGGQQNNQYPMQEPRQGQQPSVQALPAAVKIDTKIEFTNMDEYFKKFGKPPGPCRICQFMHWERHCISHLKE